MPIYEYQCQECNESFEVLVRTAANGDHVSCPSCAGEQVTKKFSAFATAIVNQPSSSVGKGGNGFGSCGHSCGCHH